MFPQHPIQAKYDRTSSDVSTAGSSSASSSMSSTSASSSSISSAPSKSSQTSKQVLEDSSFDGDKAEGDEVKFGADDKESLDDLPEFLLADMDSDEKECFVQNEFDSRYLDEEGKICRADGVTKSVQRHAEIDAHQKRIQESISHGVSCDKVFIATITTITTE